VFASSDALSPFRYLCLSGILLNERYGTGSGSDLIDDQVATAPCTVPLA